MMANISIINPCSDKRWDEFVFQHPFGRIYHTSGWVQLLTSTFPHIQPCCIALEENNTIVAALPLFFVSSILTGKRLVSIPFATLCDPLVSSGEQMQLLLEKAQSIYKEKKCSFMEIRALEAGHFMAHTPMTLVDNYYYHYLNLQKPLNDIYAKFHRSCIRQRITRAEKSDIQCIESHEADDIKHFYQLQIKTRKRSGLPPQPYSFFKSMYEILSQSHNFTLLLAKKDNKFIASMILLQYKDRVSAEYAASDDEYKKFSPNQFIFWEAIKNAHNTGSKIFDFGRTSPANKGLMKFKKNWGAVQSTIPQFYFPKSSAPAMNGTGYSFKKRLVFTMTKKTPESVLPLMGELCYRHLG